MITFVFSTFFSFYFSETEVSAISFNTNLLYNPGAELGMAGWTEVPSDGKTYTWQTENPWGDEYVHSGERCFRAGDNGDGYIYQDVDLISEQQRISRGEDRKSVV